MCGLYGMVTTKPSKKNIKAVRALGILMQTRGEDSTGIAVVTDKARIYKKAVSASEFFNEKLTIDSSARVIIGHTRLATTGAITDENSHPFRYGDITGSHNGIIQNHGTIGDFQVDSQAIFYLLNKHKNSFIQAFPKIQGSCAISWTDNNNVYLVRHGNPLYIIKADGVIFWASELMALRTVIEFLDIRAKIYELKEDIVVTIDKNLEFKKTKVEFGKTQYQTSYSYGYGDYTRQVTPTKIDDEYNDFLQDNAREVANNDGCMLCNKTISKKEVFFINENSWETYHKNCRYRLKKDNSLDEFTLVEF